MKIDTHVHCAGLSDCSGTSAEEMIEAAIRKGLDGLLFTNHHKFVPEEDLAEYNRKFAPFRIFNGIESDVEKEDIIIIGSKHPAYTVPDKWSYKEVVKQVRADGGSLIIAHPFRRNEEFQMDLFADPPDAIECYSNNVKPDKYERVQTLAAKLGIPVTAGSDGHGIINVGSYYVDFDCYIEDEMMLAEMIRQGRFTCTTERLGVKP